MKLKLLSRNWDKLGKIDPLLAVLTYKEKQGGKWNKGEFMNTGKREVADTIEYLKSLKITPVFGKALDFGCGVGRLTQALCNRFDEVIGVDIAPSMIHLANEYNEYGNKCKYFINKNDALKMFIDNHFDFVYSKITLQHMEPEYSKNYIKEFLRILKPSGILIFQIPSEPSETMKNLQYGFRQKIKTALPSLHKLYYNTNHYFKPVIEMYAIKKDELVKFIEDNGGKLIEVKKDNASGENWISFQYYITK